MKKITDKEIEELEKRFGSKYVEQALSVYSNSNNCTKDDIENVCQKIEGGNYY